MIRTLIINKDLGTHKKDSKVRIKCTEEGIPLEVFWRRRLKDSNIDNCVEWEKETKRMKHVEVEDKSNKRRNRNSGDKS